MTFVGLFVTFWFDFDPIFFLLRGVVDLVFLKQKQALLFLAIPFASGGMELRLGVALPRDLVQHIRLIPLEILVVENDLVEAACALMEVVHVELPLERIEVTMLIILWKHLLLKNLARFNFKGSSVLVPMNHMLQILRIADLVQDEHEEGNATVSDACAEHRR